VQLDPESRREIEAYKGSVTPSASTRESNWEAIASRALRGDAPEWVDDPEIAPRRRRPPRWLLGGALAVAAAVVAMLAHGGKLMSRDASSAAPASASYEVSSHPTKGESSDARERPDLEGAARVAEPRVEAPEEAELAPSEEAELAPSENIELAPSEKAERPEPVLRTRRSPTADRASEPERKSEPIDPLATVRAESSLVGRARAALRDEDPATALRLLDEHARRFPTGELEQERELLRISALCDAGRAAAARKAAHSFRAAYPGSPLLGHLGSTCAADR
jgi:hypothetical protein